MHNQGDTQQQASLLRTICHLGKIWKIRHILPAEHAGALHQLAMQMKILMGWVPAIFLPES